MSVPRPSIAQHINPLQMRALATRLEVPVKPQNMLKNMNPLSAQANYICELRVRRTEFHVIRDWLFIIVAIA
jgi:hypothetical protein